VQAWIVEGKLKIMDGFVTERAFQDFCRKCGQNSIASCWAMRFEIGLQMATRFACRLTRMPVLFLPLKGMLLLQDSAPNATDKMRGNVFFKHVKNCKGTASQNKTRMAVPLRRREFQNPHHDCLENSTV